MPGPDQDKPNTPKVATKPPYKQTLSVPRLGEGEELRQIGTPPNQKLIVINKAVLRAEAFVAPHVIADAIKDLPKERQDLINKALMQCTNDPTECDDGFINERDRHLTAQNNGSNGVHHADPVARQKQADHDLREAQRIIQNEERREKQLLERKAPAGLNPHIGAGTKPKKPTLETPKQ